MEMIRHTTLLIKGRCATDGTNDGSTVTLSGRAAEPLIILYICLPHGNNDAFQLASEG